MTKIKNLSDAILEQETEKLFKPLLNSLTDLSQKEFESNKIDPLSFIIESLVLNQTPEEWVTNERFRQVQKSLSNAYGEFHQNILGSFDGWRIIHKNEGLKLDVCKQDKTILAEIKNKHNTMNSSSTKETFNKMKEIASRPDYKKSTIYLVQIIPKTNKPPQKWMLGEESHERIQIASGSWFYDRVSGENGTLANLLQAVYEIILSKKSTIEQTTGQKLAGWIPQKTEDYLQHLIKTSL